MSKNYEETVEHWFVTTSPKCPLSYGPVRTRCPFVDYMKETKFCWMDMKKGSFPPWCQLLKGPVQISIKKDE